MENTPKKHSKLSFEDYYFEAFSNLINKTIYTVSKENTDKEVFFTSLINKTNAIKKSNGRLFFVGNGASSAFANHMALDWSKNGNIKSFSLSDSSLLTALSNDISYEDAFSKFLEIYDFNENDLVITISSSGNSKNIISVLNYCKKHNIKTVGFSGLNNDNLTQQLVDYSIFIPCKTYGFAECIHQFFLHLWLDKFMKIEEWTKSVSQNMDSNNFKI
jgi:D-sedoheptulose 7-phosphate isomerase